MLARCMLSLFLTPNQQCQSTEGKYDRLSGSSTYTTALLVAYTARGEWHSLPVHTWLVGLRVCIV